MSTRADWAIGLAVVAGMVVTFAASCWFMWWLALAAWRDPWIAVGLFIAAIGVVIAAFDQADRHTTRIAQRDGWKRRG